ncbi:MAG: hypothetical protein QM539_02990 [Alphaproteobacteria bacterium]|nr:hypothetical protein [Alphaproteobacteria bacterium]
MSFEDFNDFFSDNFDNEEDNNDNDNEMLVDKALFEIIQKYKNYKQGLSKQYPDEDEFGEIIEYFILKPELDFALSIVEDALSIYPQAISIWLDKVTIYIKMDDFILAEQTLLIIQKFDPLEPYQYVLKIEMSILRGRLEDIVDTMKQAEQILKFSNDNLIDFYFDAIDLFEDYEYFDNAYDLLIKILQIIPDEDFAIGKLLQLTDLSKKHLATIEFCNLMIEKMPYEISFWTIKGICYSYIRQFENSIESFKFAYVIDENNALINNLLLLTYIKTKKYVNASELYQDGLHKTPPIKFEKELVSELFLKLKLFPEARHVFIKNFNENPDLRSEYELEKVADIYLKEKKYSKALYFLEQIIKRNPYNYLMYYKTGICYEQLNKYHKAIEHYKSSINLNFKNSKSWLNIIECYLKLKNYDLALSFAFLYLKNFKIHHKLIYFISVCYFKLNIELQAINFFMLGYKMNKRTLVNFYKYCPEARQNELFNKIINKLNLLL